MFISVPNDEAIHLLCISSVDYTELGTKELQTGRAANEGACKGWWQLDWLHRAELRSLFGLTGARKKTGDESIESLN